MMIADTAQRAIFDESARYHRFLEYRVAGESERGPRGTRHRCGVAGGT